MPDYVNRRHVTRYAECALPGLLYCCVVFRRYPWVRGGVSQQSSEGFHEKAVVSSALTRAGVLQARHIKCAMCLPVMM